jgi:predicted NBD/HSP70 family sugar kinase
MYLVFDIGGTRMRLSNSFDGENFQNIEIHSTPQEFEEAVEIIDKFIRKADSTNPDNLFCVGIAGVFDKDKNNLVASPNLPSWVGKPIREHLERAAKTKVNLQNDADMAALGEAINGAGKDYRIVAYITVGTGVGGARVVDKKIDISTYGFEPGHQIMDVDGTITGKVSDLEALVGGVGIKMRYSKNPEEITDKSTWEEINKFLAIGLVNTIVHWSPDIVVLGGSVAQNENISVEKIRLVIKDNLKVFPNIPEIKKGLLGEKAALLGGLSILKDR